MLTDITAIGLTCSATYSDGKSFQYEYDAVGNRTISTQSITSTLVTTYTYDVANRLTSVNGQAYTWDANGNPTNDGNKTYLYNQANQLITVTASGLTWSAAYNGDGARLQQIVNSAPTTYTLDLAAPLVTALTERTGATTKQYLYGLGDSPMAVYTGTAWTYLSGRDGLNSVRQETDAAGNVLTTRNFDPYGVPLQGGGGTPFGYTGEQTDNTGLVFLRARYMQPTLGVFLSRGPLFTSPFYRYASSNPVNNVDPSGYIDWPSGYLEGVARSRTFAACVTGIEGEEIVYDFASKPPQRARFTFVGMPWPGGFLGDRTPPGTSTSVGDVTGAVYDGFIWGFKPGPDGHIREYSGPFYTASFGSGVPIPYLPIGFAGGGLSVFHSLDGSMWGASVYAGVGLAVPIDSSINISGIWTKYSLPQAIESYPGLSSLQSAIRTGDGSPAQSLNPPSSVTRPFAAWLASRNYR